MKIRNAGAYFLYILSFWCMSAICVSAAVGDGVFNAKQIMNSKDGEEYTLPSDDSFPEKLYKDSWGGGNRLKWSSDKLCESGFSYGVSTDFQRLLDAEYFTMIDLLLNKDLNEDSLKYLSDLKYWMDFRIDYYCHKVTTPLGVTKVLVDNTVLASDVDEAFAVLDKVAEAYEFAKISIQKPESKTLSTMKSSEIESNLLSLIREKALSYMNMILVLYYSRLKIYCRQMSAFYSYICRRYGVDNSLDLIPEWNTVPANNCPFGLKNSTSATHTEFMMVYKILQDKGMPRREDGLLKMDSVADFNRALGILKRHLPAEIYSAKAMCPVCEAFLTSLYNVCGCEGVFISKLNDYNSPSGPAGALKKVYLNKTKDGTYVDLPPGHEKAAPVTNSHKIKPY